MSLFGILDSAKSAIFASQTALNVVSNNIANINTPGYSRHEVILEVANPVQVRGDFIGRGVQSGGIRRHYDKFLHLQIIGQNQSFGRSFALDQGLQTIEQVFNEARDLGLANYMKDYFNAWHDVSNNPEGQPERTALIHKARTLIQTAKQMENDILDTMKYINSDIDNVIQDINSITSKINVLNEKISLLEAGLTEKNASYFRDQRDTLLNELAELTDYSWFELSDGQISVLIDGRGLVNPGETYNLSTQFDQEGKKRIYLRGVDITASFTNGKLGGYLSVRDDIEATPLVNLRKLMASVVKETNLLHNSGYGLDGSTGNDFFSPLSLNNLEKSLGGYISASSITDISALTLDEYDINFTSASSYEVYNRRTSTLVTSGTGFSAGDTISFEGIDVTVDGTLAAEDSFLISPLRGLIHNLDTALTDPQQVAAAESDPTTISGPGDNLNAVTIAGLATTGNSDLSGATFEDYYEGIVTTVGTMSKAAADGLSYDDNVRFELEKKRDAVSGVSLDEEAANLIRFQRAYEAGARMIRVTDELLETILNL
ncbi:MAG: flagellar hook-associated protein FlgK [Nitrospiraceae bacterium]|nr:MAG: flagellar hook-associated protein FlgK [Nitrospiraceae bacterium]